MLAVAWICTCAGTPTVIEPGSVPTIVKPLAHTPVGAASAACSPA